VDVFRINASHGTRHQHAGLCRLVRDVAKEQRVHPAILLDLQGPKIRLGKFERGSASLCTGSIFTVTVRPVLGTAEMASTGFGDFADVVIPGSRVLLADGAVELRALETDGASVRCEVVCGGTVGDHQGINLPNVHINRPSLTDKDYSDLDAGLANGADLVALSFVRGANDVRQLREYVERRRQSMPLIAKIEKPEAYDNLDEILSVSDGVMVARGDLGVETALEKVPMLQKAIIDRAQHYGKFVITATQMLQSMVADSRPTRAEVSDVANAVYDGTDAVMLSAETASGRFPVEAVRMMSSIASSAQSAMPRRPLADSSAADLPTHPDVLVRAAVAAARSEGVKAIVVFTTTGATARLIARCRPPIPVFAFCATESVARNLSVIYGVNAILLGELASIQEMLQTGVQRLLAEERLRRDDTIILVAGEPIGVPGTTNLMKIYRVGEMVTPCRTAAGCP
jgi:pyruvate kinase